MAFNRVQSVRVTDKSAEYLLLKVSALSEDSPTLTLTATEGIEAYVTQWHRKDFDKARSSSSKVSVEEWRAIVEWLLLHKSPPSASANLVAQTELVCSVEPNFQVTLLFRQNIGGITHRLGSIQLKLDTEDGIVPVDCAIIAADDRDRVERDVLDLQRRYDEQQGIIDKLGAQLADLIEAKKSHEDELLEKFRHLLNSKKAKIRDQMRLLATVDIDRTTAEKVTKNHAAGNSSSTNGTGSKTSRRGQKRGIDKDKDMETEDEPNTAAEDPETEGEATPEQNDDTTDEESPIEQPPSSKPRKTVSPQYSQTRHGTSSSPSSQHLVSKPASQARSSQTSKASQATLSKAPSTRAARSTVADDSDSDGFETAPAASQAPRRRAAERDEPPASQRKASTQSLSPPPPRELPFRKHANATSPAVSQTKTASAPAKHILADDEDTEEEDFGEL